MGSEWHSNPEFGPVLRKLAENPSAVLAAARRRSVNEALVIAHCWKPQRQGGISAKDVVDLILSFLPESDVPAQANPVTAFCQAAHWAHIGLSGINQLGPALDDPSIVQRVIKGWIAIFKWSVFMFFARVQELDKGDKRRAHAIKLISSVWYTLCSRQGPLREKITSTMMSIELAIKLWLEEDDTALGEDPSPAALLLGRTLRTKEHLDRVLVAVNGKAGAITKVAIARLKRVLDTRPLNPSRLDAELSAINALSIMLSHPLRHAFLGANVIWYATSALGPISADMASSHDSMFLDAMSTAFLIVYNHLDSTDGFTWVSQAVGAGLLTYFADCSQYFSRLHPIDLERVQLLVSQKLPPYLVYRSVLEAMTPSMNRINEGSKRTNILSSPAKDTWLAFETLYNERVAYLTHSRSLDGRLRACDNLKCQKRADKEEIRRCSACLTTFYCSKECQAIAWKEGDHKKICKLKQRERIEGKPDKISRRNIKFFYGCAIIDARRNITSLIGQANQKYPGKPYYNLIISVDFTVIPTAYTLQPIEEFDFSQCTMNGPPTRARTEAMIEKVQKNPGTFTLVATTVVVGLTVRSFMAIVPYDVWEGFPGGEPPPALAGLSHSGPSGPLRGSHAPGRTESNQPDLFEGFMKAMNELWEQEGNFLDDE